MSAYDLSTPEGRAEVRRMVATIPESLDCTGGVVWTVRYWYTDNDGSYEMEQEKVADTSPYYAPFFAAAPTLLLAALEEVERLRGITPELPDRPPDGCGMPRYGIRWNGPTEPMAVSMEDGYWTPWHLANREIERLERELANSRAGLVEVEPGVCQAPNVHAATQDICEAAGAVTPKEPVDLMAALRQGLANAEEADKKRKEPR